MALTGRAGSTPAPATTKTVEIKRFTITLSVVHAKRFFVRKRVRTAVRADNPC